MQNLGQAVKDAWGSMTSCPSDIEHECPHCKQIVPKLTLTVLGVEKIVQPRCHCEVANYEKGVTESAELKYRREIERKFSISSLGERFAESRFGVFALREGVENAAKQAHSYAKSFGEYAENSLLIWGPSGNGKSHLAAAVCHFLKDKDYIPVFMNVPELLERIRNTFNRNTKETEMEIMDALRNCDLLVLDDIGSEKIGDWVLDVLFRIIDGRYRKKKPTLFTTNYSPTELLYRFMPKIPTFEDEIAAKRLHDRIVEVSIFVENKGSSYRMEKAVQRAEELKRQSESA